MRCRQGGSRGESPQGHSERLCLEREARLAATGRKHHNKTSITGQVLRKKNVFLVIDTSIEISVREVLS